MNNGKLFVNSPNTLEMSDIINNGALTNCENGHIVAKDGIQTSGTMNNEGDINGSVIVEDGSFTMTGGTINAANDVKTYAVYNVGTFTMESGTINGGADDGVCTVINRIGTFIMKGGTVIGEKTYAVNNYNSSFTMEGGTVNGKGTCAVYNRDVDFIMTGGEIISSGSGDVVCFEGGTLTLEDGRITNSGDGYALQIIGVADKISYAGTTFRAKQSDRFISGGDIPANYTVSGPDGDGYYVLAYLNGQTLGLIGDSIAAAGVPVRSKVLAAAADSPSPFKDVPETMWYADAVRYVYEHGMMNGTGYGAFSPDMPTSRGMVVTVLHRLEGTPAALDFTFADVPDGQWYTDAVAWAGRNGIVKGYGDGNFGPNDPVTREQMAAILYRYAAYKEYNTVNFGDAAIFPDGNTVSPYASDAVNWAVGNGMLRGSDDMLLPSGSSTRAQTAALLMRFCEDAARSYPMTVVNSMDVMCEPSGILFLEDGSFLVTDTYSNVIWQSVDGVGTVYAGGSTVTDLFGRPLGGYNDAGLTDSYFNAPWAIVPFMGGYAVADAGNNVLRLIRGQTVQTINGSTGENLSVTGLGVSFDHPTGLACDGDGNLYVSDTFKGAVRRITPEGNVSTLIDGLTDPMGLCWKDGTLYIVEAGANRIVKVTDGQLTVVAGSGDEDLLDGPAAQAAFASPQGVAVGEDGTIYVSDTVSGTVRQIKNGVVTTLAYRDESDLNSVIPTSPMGLTVRGDHLYVCDSFAWKVFAIALKQ